MTWRANIDQFNGDGVARRVHAPTKTAQTPPKPPAIKDFAFSAAADKPETGAFVIALAVVACPDWFRLCIQYITLDMLEKKLGEK
jgi:hypothetical protein